MTHNTRERVEEVVKQFEARMPLITSHGLLLEARLTPTNYEAMKRWLRTTLHQELQKAREEGFNAGMLVAEEQHTGRTIHSELDQDVSK